MRFDDLELPCIFVPEGGKLPAIPWGDPAIFPAIFIPDGYQGARPGYPWIEFGRVTLRVDKARRPRKPASAPTTAPTRPSPSVSYTEPSAVTPDQPATGSLAPRGIGLEGTMRPTNALPDLGAAVRTWNSLSDLSATMAALDALSPTSPYVRGLTGMRQGDFPGEESRSVQVSLAAATDAYHRAPGSNQPGSSATQVQPNEPEEEGRAPPDPDKDAIRPVYPLETLIGLGAAAITGGALAAARAAGGAILRQIIPRPSPGEAPASILFPGGQPIGRAGTSEPIRELPGGREAAEELFKRLTKGGEDVTPPGHRGTLIRMPDGSYIGYRPNREAVRRPST